MKRSSGCGGFKKRRTLLRTPISHLPARLCHRWRRPPPCHNGVRHRISTFHQLCRLTSPRQLTCWRRLLMQGTVARWQITLCSWTWWMACECLRLSRDPPTRTQLCLFGPFSSSYVVSFCPPVFHPCYFRLSESRQPCLPFTNSDLRIANQPPRRTTRPRPL